MPGRTPTAVPTVTPRADQSRLKGVNATAKPWPSEARDSIIVLSLSVRPGALRRGQAFPSSPGCPRFLFGGFLIGRSDHISDHAAGQVEAKAVVEDAERRGSEGNTEGRVDHEAPAAKGAGHGDEEQRGSGNPAQGFQQEYLDQEAD